jgi:hypothetical protein
LVHDLLANGETQMKKWFCILLAPTMTFAQIPAKSPTCQKAIAVAKATASGVIPYDSQMIDDWWQKNSDKHPTLCWSQKPVVGIKNYLLVVSESTSYLTGVVPVVRKVTSTSQSTGTFSADGTATDNYGEMWQYTAHGTVDTTTTTETEIHEDAQFTQIDRGLYINAYAEDGTLVGEVSHIYSKREGGDSSSTVGHNLHSLIAASGAKGRMMTSIVKQIETQP